MVFVVLCLSILDTMSIGILIYFLYFHIASEMSVSMVVISISDPNGVGYRA